MNAAPLTILLIDSDSDYSEVVRKNLEQTAIQDVRIVVEPVITEAVKRLAAEKFDVIVASMSLTDGDGILNEENKKRDNLPLIGIVAQDEAFNLSKSYFKDFVVKQPIQADIWSRVILNTIEREKLKTSLEHTENDLRKVIERTVDSIVVVDQVGRILFLNPAAEQLFDRQTLQVGDIFGFPITAGDITELDVLRRSGARAIVEMRIVNIEWNGQDAWLASIRDVTMRKLTAENLESVVRERTAELQRQSEKLRQMYEVADSAARVRAQFIANISHEVRTPMAGIVSGAELLCIAENMDEYHELAQSMFSSSKQLLQLMESVLDFSKLESGGVKLNQGLFSPKSIVESVLLAVTPAARSKDLELGCEISSDIPAEMFGDEVKIRQVLLNLTHNAIKFTSKGSVKLALKLDQASSKADQDNLRTLEFTVTDTGIGMTKKDSNAIFQPFVQGNSSIHQNFGGTGLGLSICKELVRAFGGELTFKSEPQMGSQFTFTVPLPIAKTSGT